MFAFIPADQLKKQFSVSGHFYSVILETGERLECRSDLEIISKDIEPDDEAELLKNPVDGICIMMNPGSSQPLTPVDQVVSENKIGSLETFLASTKPDTTQYQVMRIMHYCQWKHVRVLNISDLRDPKSINFIKNFQRLEKENGYLEHSIFSEKRNLELQQRLNKKDEAPIILAWGVSPDLEPLITRCLEKINYFPEKIGLLKENTENKYFHPLPTLQKGKLEWVDKIVKLLGKEK